MPKMIMVNKFIVSICGGLAFVCALISMPKAVSAEPIRFINIVIPPFVEEANGKAAGPAVELAAELARSAGISYEVALLPQARLAEELQKPGRVAIAMVRTPQREPNFLWIGEVHADALAFATVKPNPAIDSMDAAKGAGLVGALMNSVPADILQKNGFSSLELVTSEAFNAKKLDAGRIKGWFASEAAMRTIWRSQALDSSKLQVGKPVIPLPFWIFATKDVPAEVVEKMRTRYQEMKANGEYDRIFSALK